MQIALSAGIQKMVHSDLASSGVMFPIDTESGFDKVVFITSTYGLGETIVQGTVNPDETAGYIVFDVNRLRVPMQQITDFIYSTIEDRNIPASDMK